MIREGNRSDPYTKFKSAGKLAKTVAHWKTKGIDAAVSRFIHSEKCFLKLLWIGRHSGKIQLCLAQEQKRNGKGIDI